MSGNNNIFSVIKRRGTAEILSRLRFFPKRYNRLKKELGSVISSRTLDHRLSDMRKIGLIGVNILEDEVPAGTEYFLTETGILVEGILYAFPQSTAVNVVNKDNDIDADIVVDLNTASKFNDLLNLYLEIVTKYNWNSVWHDICGILDGNTFIETISQKKRNDIDSYNSKQIFVTTAKGTEPVEVDKIKFVWRNLLIEGRLELEDHEKTTYRSSFICALLSHLNYVEVDEGKRKSIFLIEPVKDIDIE